MRALALIPLTTCAVLTACGSQQDQDATLGAIDEASTTDTIEVGLAQLRDKDGTEVGTAILTKNSDSFSLALNLKDLPAGEHGLHFHTSGLCEGPEFTSAGGHLNPEGNTHGKLSEGGQHLGDLPNITIGADGTLTQNIALTWGADANAEALFDSDGTALMVHAGPDDYITDPAGDAGPRIACGILLPTDSAGT